MLEKPVSWFLFFGTSFRFLQDVSGQKIKGDGHILDSIERFFVRLDELGLTVTGRAAKGLRDFKEAIATSTEERLTPAEVAKLRSVMEALRPTLMAETGGKVAYIVSERRFPIESLLSKPSALFAEGVFEALPELAQSDFG